jgi:hypothetical protein
VLIQGGDSLDVLRTLALVVPSTSGWLRPAGGDPNLLVGRRQPGWQWRPIVMEAGGCRTAIGGAVETRAGPAGPGATQAGIVAIEAGLATEADGGSLVLLGGSSALGCDLAVCSSAHRRPREHGRSGNVDISHRAEQRHQVILNLYQRTTQRARHGHRVWRRYNNSVGGRSVEAGAGEFGGILP